MGFFAWLFGRGKGAVAPPDDARSPSRSGPLTAPASPPPPAPPRPQAARGISYDPNLVAQLKEDHRQLLRLYGEIQGAALRGEYSTVTGKLADLKLAFQTHIMVENVKFYVYLQQYLANDPELTTFLAEVRREMDGIASVLVKFINKYTAAPAVAGERGEEFLRELSGIGAVLGKRVQLEEARLYTLYLPR